MTQKQSGLRDVFSGSNVIHLWWFLLNPRYNHDKIIREFKQRCRKIGILHFPYGGYFFCFSSIIFLTQKDPCRSHFCERQRPSTTYDLIRSGEMEQRSHSTGSVSPFRFLTIPGVPDAAFSCSIRRRTASMMYSVTLFPSFWAATWTASLLGKASIRTSRTIIPAKNGSQPYNCAEIL